VNIVDIIEKENLKKDAPVVSVGDTVKVFYTIKEGDKERLQAYEGTVISKRNGSVRETFTVRRISYGIGVERTFPVHSPIIDKLEVSKVGLVRRAKLNYIRTLSAKASRIKEKRTV